MLEINGKVSANVDEMEKYCKENGLSYLWQKGSFSIFKEDNVIIGKWIKCSERMPEMGKDVLVCAQDAMGIAYEKREKYLALDSVVIWNDGHKPSFRTERFGYGEVIAWMELPDMPKEE